MDNDINYNSDEEILDKEHSRLLESVSKLDKSQYVKRPTRTEPSLQVSEFNLVKPTDKKLVHVSELTKILNKKASHVEIQKKIKVAHSKAKTLQKPLEKPEAQKIKRQVGYKNVTKSLDRWNAVVAANRAARSLTFPAYKKPKINPHTSVNMITRFNIKSDLEKALEELNPKQENKEQEKENEEEHSLSLEQIIERRREMAKLRAQQSYREAKARRQGKIKSKKFHRVQKREKIKQQMKEFELLQKTDPEAALKKIEEIERVRVEERHTLRHRSTGQWAKNKQVRAKYDKESRQELAQQLSISKELTQKQKADESSDSENEPEAKLPTTGDNPWVNGVKSTAEINDFVSGYRKYWDEKNKNDELKQKYESLVTNGNKEDNEASDNDDEIESNTTAPIKLSNGPSDVEVFVVNVTKEDAEKINKETERLENKKETNSNKKQSKISPNKEKVSKVSQKLNKDKKETDSVKKQLKISPNKEKISKVSKKLKSEMLNKVKKLKEDSSIIQNETKITKKSQTKTKKKKPMSTSTWEVTPTKKETSKTNVDIDKLFDKLDGKIQNKIMKKVKLLQNPTVTKKNKVKPKKLSKKKSKSDSSDLSFKKKVLYPEIDEELVETSGQNITNKLNFDKMNYVSKSKVNEKSDEKIEDIDPNEFINIKPTILKTKIPDIITAGEDAIDDPEITQDQQGIISEAFQDDDIIADFEKDKQDEIDKNKPKDIDLSLPGWGAWGGKDIKISKRKRKRFIIKMPKKMPRRDDNKGNLVINEHKDKKIRNHQVNQLPFPFKSVKEFEAAIRAPVGSTFIPELAHKRLTKPNVITKAGQIIEPMDDEVLLKKQKKRKIMKK